MKIELKTYYRGSVSAGKYFIAVAFFTAAVVMSAGNAMATTIISTNLAEMSELAEHAFVVKIDSVETSSSGKRSFDIVTGTVVDPIFGDKQASETVTWRQFRFGQTVPLPAMPTYEPGKEYLIFLSGPGTGPGFQSPIGLGQGSFTITRNPRTGAAIARNAYMNSTLGAGLNVDAAADAMAAKDARTRGLDNAAEKREAAALKAQLRSRGGGASLDAIKKAARYFHSEKQRGAKPSRDFKTTAPVRVLR